MQDSTKGQTNFQNPPEIEESQNNFKSSEIFAFSQQSGILFDAYGEPTCLNSQMIMRGKN